MNNTQNIKVTFSAQWKIGKEIKSSRFVEYLSDETAARIRAMALNWTIASMEVVAL